jgi:glycosidase
MSGRLYTLRRLLLAAFVGWLGYVPAIVQGADSTNFTTRKSPDWLKSSVIYEIFPRNFSREGDLNAVTARLDELKDLGVDILWLMPVHPIGEKLKKGAIGSPFAVRDFYAINPDYGTTNDFKRLIDESHKRGMKVIMDIVAGQTAWDSVLMVEHPEFYLKDTNGAVIPPNPAWSDVAGLDYTKPEVRHYMIDMMNYWLRDYQVDGFRCDVAPTVPVDFWEAARTELEKTNPQLIILADAGAKPELLAKAFDADSSWGFVYTLDWVMRSVEPAAYLKESWERTDQQFPKGALHLRFTDNHEQVRAIARYGMEAALAAQVFMLTLDGVPLLYNGMEAGDATESCDPALFEKMPIMWHPAGRPPLREIYRDLIKVRKQSGALTSGQVIWLQNTVGDEVVSLERKDAKDDYLVLINLASRRASGTVDMPDTAGFEPVKIAARNTSIDPLPSFNLGGYEWFLFHRKIAQ